MRTLARPALAAALALVLTLGTTGLSAHADEVPAESDATSAPVESVEAEPVPATPTSAADPATLASPADVSPADVSPAADEPPADDPPPTEPVDDDVLTVDDAQFRWSLTAQLHKRPYYGRNFLSAGVLPDTKGADMPSSLWKQSLGAVSIVRAEGAKYVPATWKTFGTGADHQVVMSGGKGTVNLTQDSATIAWTGSFGVARYSGQTGFTISDPTLVVEDGIGRVEGTLDGYGVSRDGNGSGAPSGPLATKKVALANLGKVKLDRRGFSITPAFYGVNANHADQKVDSQGRVGSFPAPFVEFISQVGQAPYWMTSGATDDALKAASPVTISFNTKDAVVVKPPKPTDDTPEPVVNKTKNAPKPTPQQPQTAPPAPIGFVPLSLPPVVDAPVETMSFTPTSVSSLSGVPAVLAGTDGESTLGWWLAATFLLMAAIAAALPGLLARSRAT